MNLFILCQDQAFREGLECLFEELDEKINVLASSGSGTEGLELAARTAPDVAVISFQLNDLNGLDTTRRLLEKHGQVKVLILSGHPLKEPVADAMEAGALGYTSIDTDKDELLRALRTVADGKRYLCSDAAEALVTQSSEPEEDPVFAYLTPREREVLQLLSEGYGSKEVGEKLNISSKTVDSHRQNMMEKLDTDNLPDLVKHAIRAGLTSIDPQG